MRLSRTLQNWADDEVANLDDLEVARSMCDAVAAYCVDKFAFVNGGTVTALGCGVCRTGPVSAVGLSPAAILCEYHLFRFPSGLFLLPAVPEQTARIRERESDSEGSRTFPSD